MAVVYSMANEVVSFGFTSRNGFFKGSTKLKVTTFSSLSPTTNKNV